MAGSIALVGFGLDSIVEVSSGVIILWQFRHPLPESRERRALKLMALSFFALAAYVAFESVRALHRRERSRSLPGRYGLAIASLLIMPFLSWAQRRTGGSLGSNAVVADSTQTLLCTYLSGVPLAGLLVNATLGWSWADPVAGLIIAGVAVREGLEAGRGRPCACGPTRTDQQVFSMSATDDGADDCCSDHGQIGRHQAEAETSSTTAAWTWSIRAKRPSPRVNFNGSSPPAATAPWCRRRRRVPGRGSCRSCRRGRAG